MTAKLTLSINEEVIKKAKLKAKKEGKSLSAMVEDYLVFASVDIKENNKKTNDYPELVNKLAGSLKMKLPKNFNTKKFKQERLLKKHGL